mmetsp:Transcript_55945/g.132743  ORF Transcript_55945/g.132743 Transcript_55945/m.132743 type:complete len:188 (+) Transcript_55945:873-1436(+)
MGAWGEAFQACEETPAAADDGEDLKKEAMAALRAWIKYAKSIKWYAEFKDVKGCDKIPMDNKDIKPLEHLMEVPVARIYLNIYKNDPQRLTFGYIPYMAVSSEGQVGALQAEAFCECCFSVMKQVVNDSNASIGDKFIDKVTTLRANRRFMKFMRANHHNEVFPIKKSDPVYVDDLADDIGALYVAD